MNDRRLPWLMLVPARPDVTELIELDAADRARLIEELALASTVLRDLFRRTKMNVAALGNVVAQLHVHVIARFASDAAWPGPAWGTTPEPLSTRRDRPDAGAAALPPCRPRLNHAAGAARRALSP